jgi:thioredoxin reductase
MNKSIDLVIIGGGSAGLAAAIGAYHQGIRNLLIIEKDRFLGGILNQCIHHGFGLTEFKEQLTGPEYAERFINEVHELKIPYLLDTMVLDIDKNKKVTYANAKQGIVTLNAKAIIVAPGCYERHFGMIQIPGDRLNGVLTAGVAQRYLNIEGYLVGKRVFILGSGDIGLIMARRMTLEGAKVLGVAEINKFPNGLNRNVVQCLVDYNIPLYLSHTVTKIIGQEQLEKIVISKVDDHYRPIKGSEKELQVDTLLLSIGLLPSNELLDNLNLQQDVTHGPIVDQNFQTAIPGVFSCGNGLHVHDLVDFVSSEAKQAGINAAYYIKNHNDNNRRIIKVKHDDKITYVVPQIVDVNNIHNHLEIKFRVKRPFNNSIINIKQGEQLIQRIVKLYLLPAEMVIIKISKEKIDAKGEQLTVNVEEKQ